MPFTRKQLNRVKQCLLVAGIAFAVQLGVPQISLAAAQNYGSIGQGGEPEFTYSFAAPERIALSEDDIIDRGEKLSVASSGEAGSLPLEGAPKVVAERWLTVTAYSSEPQQTDSTPFTTAWITPVRDGVVAANFLPKGSMVRFPDKFGDKIFIVEDRMNARYTYRADIWMHTREEAKQFGIQYLRMEVLAAQVPREYVLTNFEPAFPGMK